MARDGPALDRWGVSEVPTPEKEEHRPTSSSHKAKKADKKSRRDKDGEKSGHRDKDRSGKDKDKDKSRSSKHSKDKEKGHHHHHSSSSSRKRDRSEDRATDRSRDRSRERSKDRSSNHSKDRSSDRPRDRSKERTKGRSSRDVDSDADESRHKRRRREDRDREKNGDKEKDKHHRKESKHHRHRDKDGRHSEKGGSTREDDGHHSDGNERNKNGGSAANGHHSHSAVAEPSASTMVVLADGEEEGELVFEPKKPIPRESSPPRTTVPSSAPPDDKGNVKQSQHDSSTATSPSAPSASSKPSSMPAEAFVPPPPEDDEQAEEAARVARIAARAEERAAERARARVAAAASAAAGGAGASAPNGKGGGVGNGRGSSPAAASTMLSAGERGGRLGGLRPVGGAGAGGTGGVEDARSKVGIAGGAVKLSFKTKKEREQEALQRLEEQRRARREEQDAAAAERGKSERQRQAEEEERRRKEREQDRLQAREAREKEKELEVLRNQYLGVKKQKKKIVKPSEKFSKIFQFDWDASEDTSRDANPLYNKRAQLNASFGRGYLAGIDMREQRKDSAFLTALMQKRQEEQRRAEQVDTSLTAQDRVERERLRQQQMAEVAAISRAEADGLGDDPVLKGAHWSEKPLAEMGERDWRIFREDFDIRVKGGKAPLPLRFWEEGNLPSSVMEAIRDLGYEKPSPIQRQAIPIGMERRDIIGIAETGSGKTAAFGIPMIAYILSLDASMRERVADQGPLALIMAPTRELAIQIEEECIKFCKYAGLKTVCVVGGQDIEAQAFTLRKGVEIIIGTPGRLNDCVEKHYLVLNQCNYVVLDEADRMIDMGFEEQVLAVLEAMGGTLKADDEEQAYQQEKRAKEARSAKDLVRVTAMFSATMPPAVEKMAKKYLRHPAIVQIGDEDTGKNRRIEQRVLWMTEAQKKAKVIELLRNHSSEDRVLVFINTKKNADMLGRQLEQAGFKTGVLHGGKTQDQREENLEMFRDGDYTVLVATDVASRGLDIPDVKEVINYELPSKIETYSHRIGRTGRAGKDGIATSFLTEHDEEIMFGLKEYLQSTESHIPEQLRKHNAAQAAVGARRDDGTLVNSKRDSVQYSKK